MKLETIIRTGPHWLVKILLNLRTRNVNWNSFSKLLAVRMIQFYGSFSNFSEASKIDYDLLDYFFYYDYNLESAGPRFF